MPFHEGLVRFLEEEGAWTGDADRLNEELIERGETLRERWPEVADDDNRRESWPEVKADVSVPEPVSDGEPQGGTEAEDTTNEEEGS